MNRCKKKIALLSKNRAMKDFSKYFLILLPEHYFYKQDDKNKNIYEKNNYYTRLSRNCPVNIVYPISCGREKI